MDKTFSVEDLLGIWKSGGSAGNLSALAASSSFGLGCRSTSDEAFQEFLKNIPSTSNLASILEQQPESLPPSLPMAIPPLELSPPATSAATGGDIPRVTSLEFLRPFTAPKQATVPHPEAPQASSISPAPELPIKSSAPQPVGVVVASAPPSMQHVVPSMPPVRPSPLPPGYTIVPHGAPIMLAPPVVCAAPPVLPPAVPSAPMSATGTASDTPHDDDSMKKAELRRARRMLSNRESARRSRRRKQEHLNTLEDKIAGMQKEYHELEARLAAVQAELVGVRTQNAQLADENNQLRAACGMPPREVPPPVEMDTLPSRPSKRARGAATGKRNAAAKLEQAGSNGTDVPVLHAPSAKHSSDTSCKTETDKPAATTAATVKA